jgi:hypothetical protein
MPHVRRNTPSAPPTIGTLHAYWLLRTVFTVAPIVAGLDKFLGVLTDWEQYLAPWAESILPGDAGQVMIVVGVIEIVAGVLVAIRPDIGGYVVAAWLLGIIVNLVSLGDYYDVALRDFGLLIAALALARMASSTVGRRAPAGDVAAR